jgi:glucokinase
MSLALGIDVGGTKTALGIVDTATGAIVCRETLATPHPLAGSRFLSEVAEAAARLDHQRRCAVGLGLCELVTVDGVISSSWRIKWSSQEVLAAFDRWPSIAIDADVRAAARAEARFGSGRDLKHWIYANAGTGIACCLMVDGTPHFGASGLGMAWGMSPTALAGESPSATIEDLSGGAALLKAAGQLGSAATSISELAVEAERDNAQIAALFASGGNTLGRGLGTLANMLDPEAIILGGGVALASAAYREGVSAGLNEAVWPFDRRRPPILIAAIGQDAGLLGAALSV